MLRSVLAIASLICGSACAALDAAPARPVDLSGYWRLNTTLSDNAEAKLQKVLDDERKEYERWLRRTRDADPLGLPPIGEDASAQERAPRRPRPARERRDDDLRRLLGMSETLEIVQSGSTLQIDRPGESRRFDAGSRSQVSMPEGQIADSQVGWDGEWFVIDRRVRKGPRVVEKYRLIKKTGQLESQMSWSGEHILSGVKLHRVYDRAVKDSRPRDPSAGPVR